MALGWDIQLRFRRLNLDPSAQVTSRSNTRRKARPRRAFSLSTTPNSERTQRLILKRVLRREYTASCRKRLGGQLASAVRPGRRPLQSQRAESAAPFPGVPRRNSSAFSSVTRVTGHRQSSSLAPRAPSRSLRSSGATCAGASGSPPTKTGGAPTRPATTASSFSSVPYARSASSATPSTPRLRHCPGRGRRRLLVGRERRRASRRKS